MSFEAHSRPALPACHIIRKHGSRLVYTFSSWCSGTRLRGPSSAKSWGGINSPHTHQSQLKHKARPESTRWTRPPTTVRSMCIGGPRWQCKTLQAEPFKIENACACACASSCQIKKNVLLPIDPCIIKNETNCCSSRVGLNFECNDRKKENNTQQSPTNNPRTSIKRCRDRNG